MEMCIYLAAAQSTAVTTVANSVTANNYRQNLHLGIHHKSTAARCLLPQQLYPNWPVSFVIPRSNSIQNWKFSLYIRSKTEIRETLSA
jgi:hypothetical protein